MKAATSCASSASRSAGSMAGGRASAQASPAATSHSLSSRSPNGASLGSKVGLPSAARRKASRSAHRAPRRHEDQHVGHCQRIAAVFGQDATGQLVGETAVDADGEYALHANTRSASASAHGVPTWNQSPSLMSPYSRVTASARFHSLRSENGPSGESRNRRASQTEMLAKR